MKIHGNTSSNEREEWRARIMQALQELRSDNRLAKDAEEDTKDARSAE